MLDILLEQQAEPGRKAPAERKGNIMMTEERIAELEQKGFKRWTKGNMDRLYINASQLGLVCEYYKTGNISYAEFQGNSVSNCEARRMKAAKTFIDLKTEKVYSDSTILERAAAQLAGLDD